MKRIVIIVFACVLIGGTSFLVFAEQHKGGKMEKKMMGESSMHKKMMGKSKMMEKCSMAKMMKKEVVATEDGGVIVMVGNKLLKYDQDLNLKKEVEIKIDMKKMMKEMMKKCSMHKMMMNKGMTTEESGPESDMPSGHESHH